MPLGLIASLVLVDLADEWFTFLPAGAMESIRVDSGLSYAQAGVLLAVFPAGGVVGVVLMAATSRVATPADTWRAFSRWARGRGRRPARSGGRDVAVRRGSLVILLLVTGPRETVGA